jgi:UDP-glucuronate 4-epimerase
MRFLITGTAGFIGFHLARRLLADGHVVHGVDGLTPYYDPALKQARHHILEESVAFTPHIAMLEDQERLDEAAKASAPDVIVHLAARRVSATALNTHALTSTPTSPAPSTCSRSPAPYRSAT